MRVRSLGIGIPLRVGRVWICADSAYALNGFSYATSCSSCQATADFTAAAAAEAYNQGVPGLYQVVSQSQASSASVRVQGHYGGNGKYADTLVVTASFPVDGSGNSLAGQPEAYLESYYGVVDQMTFGTVGGVEFNEPLCSGSLEVPVC
jgi:hypothetical protein